MHITKVLEENIDPLEFEERVLLIKTIINRFANSLPEEIKLQPLERYAENHEEIIQILAQSKSVRTALLRKL